MDVARRTFRGNDRACWAVLLVYVLSSQMLINAMTTYAMTAHMALNLIWLAAFLRGRKVGHLVAIATGFLAVGLHQLVFHPVFVAPFLLWRLREGEWRLVGGYAVAYAVIILWWAYYPMMVAPEVAGPHGQVSEGNFLTDRVLPLLLNRDPRAIGLMILNGLRFAAWQDFAIWPLLIVAVPLTIRTRGLAKPLALGIMLWLVFLTLVLPDQGRGYGYRYLNGYLGSFALLAGYGYRELERQMGPRADGLVMILSGLTFVAAIPVLFAASYEFIAPHLAVQRLIARQSTPFVLIDDNPAKSINSLWRDTGVDHVRNLPDLTNRPLRFSARRLTPALLISLCERGKVTLINRKDMHRLGYLLNVPERSPEFQRLVSAASHEVPGCFRDATLSRHGVS